MNEARSQNDDKALPLSYHWNRSQSNLALVGAFMFAGLAGLAYVAGDSHKVDIDALCAPENMACHDYVEAKMEQERLAVPLLVLIIGGGMGLSRASHFYRRAEEIRQQHEGPSVI